MKNGKAAPIFWAIVMSLYFVILVLGIVVAAIVDQFIWVIPFAIVPGIIIFFMFYFLRERLKEIDKSKETQKEYDKY